MSGIAWSVVLTGAPDATTDLALEALSIQATLRGSSASYVQVVVPYSQLDDVLLRQNGAIVLNKVVLPAETSAELYRVNFNDLRSDVGARSRRITLSGRSEAAFPAGVAVDLVDVIEDSIQESGARSLDVSPFNDVVPGDTVTYDSTPTLIEIVQIASGASGTTMRIAEA